MLGPAHPRLPLGCAPGVRTRPVDGSDCPLVVKHDVIIRLGARRFDAIFEKPRTLVLIRPCARARALS
jgi:hypothetical protein